MFVFYVCFFVLFSFLSACFVVFFGCWVGWFLLVSLLLLLLLFDWSLHDAPKILALFL